MVRAKFLWGALAALVCWTKPVAAGDDKKTDPYPQVELSTTHGDMVIELDNVRAPKSSENFLRYVNAKFYDGVVFHRVIKEYMIQSGKFDEQMMEKPGLHDPIPCEWQNGLKNERGTIAVARGDSADSGQAQFFLNVRDNSILDQAWPGKGNAGYAVFGRVVQGMDVLDAIAQTSTVLEHEKFPGERWVVPDPPVVIKKASVLEVSSSRKPEHIKLEEGKVLEVIPMPEPAAQPQTKGAGSESPKKE